MDNDGDIDVILANCNGPTRLLLNQVGNRNHWLQFRVVGTTVNRDAYGTKVALIRRGGKPVWRRVSADGSYLSANSSRVQFGLGSDAELAAAPPDAVYVLWPNGKVEFWEVAGADQLVSLKEGGGTAGQLP